jgi:hypothetical protein
MIWTGRSEDGADAVASGKLRIRELLLPPESAKPDSLGTRPQRHDPSPFHPVAMEWAAKAGVS